MGRFSVAQGTIEQIEPIAANFVSSGVGQLLSNGWATAGHVRKFQNLYGIIVSILVAASGNQAIENPEI